jgi:hypothetical protein
MFAPQTSPASPAVSTNNQKIIQFTSFRDVSKSAPQAFPGLPMGLRRQLSAELRHVRLLFRYVAGGSTTTTIVPPRSRGFRSIEPLNLHSYPSLP